MTARERLIELIGSKVCEAYDSNCDEWQPHSCEKCYANDCSIGDLADYLLANGVLCTPCKVGDTVYAIVETTCEDIDFVHTVCEFYNEEHEDLCTLPKGKCPYKYIIQKYSVYPMNLLHFSENFGKTVFHSRKLAEKALAERIKK